ncbi:DUF962 domain-containing protein [Algicola sagamiensis]|uniref:DUF962 domain-containing protein n=1 Tax=Algicola sagamiensis TaxID=163869 RepID=UPI0003742C16|nr:DUF962 domain-containing protein [Algicola sagamiensis]
MKTFTSFRAFYPYYLSQHADPTCRAFHYIGVVLCWCCFGVALYMNAWAYLLLMPVMGYGFAWLGHGLFEKNKPATFDYPIYSFFGDWLMFYHFLTGQIQAQLVEALQAYPQGELVSDSPS